MSAYRITTCSRSSSVGPTLGSALSTSARRASTIAAGCTIVAPPRPLLLNQPTTCPSFNSRPCQYGLSSPRARWSNATTMPSPISICFFLAIRPMHPDLLAPPEEPAPRTPGLRAARRIFEAVRELHAALDNYRAFLPAEHGRALG